MNVPPSEAKRLTMWEYEALLVNWNRAHDPDSDIELPTIDDWLATQEFFADNPQFLH